MKSTKTSRFKLSNPVITFFISIAIIYLMVTLALNSIAPTRLINSSISPDRSVKVEVFSQGSLGMNWVDLITLDRFWGKKTTIYSMGGDETIFAKDMQVFWSKDSSRFLAVSEKTRHLRQKAKLISGENLILMYDIASKKLFHNLIFPLTENRFNKDEIKQVKWHDCPICK
jgi:hypothetical protein